MKVRPLRDRVIIQMTELKKQTGSGIVIPDIALGKPETGTVMAIGPGKITGDGKIIPLIVQVGDLVIFIPGIGQKVKIEGQEYIVAREDDLIGVIE